MRALSRMKVLRGTWLDPFGYVAERPIERRLIGWYEELIEIMIARLGEETRETLLAIAIAPMEIRGFGPVKESAVTRVKANVAKMLRSIEPAGDRRTD